MKLRIKERITLLNLLPSQGNITSMTIKYDLKEKIKITQEEIVGMELQESDGLIKWNDSKDLGKDIEFTELELKMIKDILKELDEKKQLNDDTFNLLKLLDAIL